MVKYLLIAGHGKQRDGSFDPGATGVITKGEHKYMRDDLFPAMKRYVPKGADIIFYDALKVSNHGNLLQLVKQYKADQVIEFHYDAAVKEARGGHVIIHTDYAPDNLDLRLRDAISDLVGVRYTHKGHKGISGRSNLYNVNVARKNGVPYRLLELGFGTNKQDADIMTQQVNGYAKRLMEAIVGEVSTPKPDNKPKPPITNPQKKSSAVVAQEVIDGKWGTNPQRKIDLEKAGYNYTEVQGIVNRIIGGQQTKPKPVTKPATTSKPTPTVYYSKKKDGKKYSAGVLKLQKDLISIHFYPEKNKANRGADGYYGNATEDAVRRFQSVYTPKEVDGIAGPKTLAALAKKVK